MTSASASTISTGATTAKTDAGRCSSRYAPVMPPSIDAGMSRTRLCFIPRSSRRYPHVPEMPPAIRPMALLTTAMTGATPRAIRMGKVTSVPEPTTVLMVPAQRPPSRMKRDSSAFTYGEVLRRLVACRCRVPARGALDGQRQAEGVAEVFLGQDLRDGALGHDAAVAQQQRVGEARRGFLQVVGDQDGAGCEGVGGKLAQA